jgi:CHAT domain-containing protein
MVQNLKFEIAQRFIFGCLSMLMFMLIAGVSAQEQTQLDALSYGTPVNAGLKRGEKHQYLLRLTAGQYMRVEVKALSSDVNLTLTLADGQKIMTVKARHGTPLGAAVTTVADADAEYRLSVYAVDAAKEDVRYRLELLEIRIAGETDQARAQAEKLYAEAEELSAQGIKAQRLQAITAYRASLPYWRAAGDRRGEADAYGSIGQAHYQLGNNQEALKAYELALPLTRDIGDSNLEAENLNNIGLLYDVQNDKQRALTYYLQALFLYRALLNRRSELVCLHNIGSVYTTRGQPQEALKWYDQALAISRELGIKVYEAQILSGRGIAWHFMENHAEALKDNEASLQIARELGDLRRQGVALTNLATTYIQLRLPLEAQARIEEALPLLRKTGYPRFEAEALHWLGESWLLLGDSEKAIEYLQQARRLRQELGEKILEAFDLSKIAQAETQRGRPLKALEYSQAALEIVEAVRGLYTSPYLSANYSAYTRHYYDEHLALLLQLHQEHPTVGYDVQAFQTSERARARALLEMLSDLATGARADVAPELLARETELQGMLDRLARESAQLARSAAAIETTAKRNEVEKQLLQLTTEYEQTQGQIRSRHSRFAILARPQPLSLAEIQRYALSPDSLLLEYLIGKNNIYLFAVTTDASQPLSVFKLTAKAEVEEAATFFKRRKFESDAEQQQRFAYNNSEFQQAAQTLSDHLLGPVKHLLGEKKLLIVSDGVLQYAPFAALPEPETRPGDGDKKQIARSAISTPSPHRGALFFQPLIARHEIVNLSSASTLVQMRKALSNRMPAQQLLAVLADPVFSAKHQLRPGQPIRPLPAEAVIASRSGYTPDLEKAILENGAVSDTSELARLPASRTEALAIASLAPSTQRLVALGFDARRDRVISGELEQFRYIHFATHAFIDERYPQFSWLALSRIDQQRRQINGYLRLQDIFKLKLTADLVVLGACRSGLGREWQGEGMLGLSRGFMYAGAPRVLVSLWDVTDPATARLMISFYRHLLRQRLTPSAALRQAQLEMWRQRRSPYFWAAFVLQGDPE